MAGRWVVATKPLSHSMQPLISTVGDAQKSARFFVRALDDYDKGLKKFPDSLDLAYNK